MSELVLAEPTPSLEVDPVQHMSVVLNRAKGWLEEAKSIDEIREAKAIAVGYESVIREKELAFDAQLAATELVRRCERRIGELVHDGQRDGSILSRGQTARRPGSHHTVGIRDGESPLRVHEAMGVTPTADEAIKAAYAMADAPSERFEQAITEARAEGNLSRANVVRKVKGEEPKPLAGRSLTLAQAHVRESEARINRIWGCAEYLSKQNTQELCAVTSDEERRVWLGQLDVAARQINDFRRRLKEHHA